MAIPTRKKLASSTKNTLCEHFFCQNSYLVCLHLDQVRNFESSAIKELCRLAGVKKSRRTPYYPMGNGQVERFYQTLLKLLETIDAEQKEDWKTGNSPHYLMSGWHPRLVIDAYLGLKDSQEH